LFLIFCKTSSCRAVSFGRLAGWIIGADWGFLLRQARRRSSHEAGEMRLTKAPWLGLSSYPRIERVEMSTAELRGEKILKVQCPLRSAAQAEAQNGGSAFALWMMARTPGGWASCQSPARDRAA